MRSGTTEALPMQWWEQSMPLNPLEGRAETHAHVEDGTGPRGGDRSVRGQCPSLSNSQVSWLPLQSPSATAEGIPSFLWHTLLQELSPASS